MQKKNTTAQKAHTTRNAKSIQRNAERLPDMTGLAAYISAMLTHPDTPVIVYNALADAVNSLNAPPGHFDSAEYIELCLRANTKATRKGGVR